MAKDAYQMAEAWGITPHDAALRMEREGWAFAGYNGAGQADYKPPVTTNEPGICPDGLHGGCVENDCWNCCGALA